jgi:hypothetical protein
LRKGVRQVAVDVIGVEEGLPEQAVDVFVAAEQ